MNTVAGIGYLIASVMSGIAIFLPGPYNIKDSTNYVRWKYRRFIK